DSIGDPRCRAWVEAWWDEATTHLTQSSAELADYRAALVARFENPAIRHLLSQIAADGSKKLRERIVPTLLAERAAGRSGEGSARVLATWVAHVRSSNEIDDVARAQIVESASGTLAD